MKLTIEQKVKNELMKRGFCDDFSKNMEFKSYAHYRIAKASCSMSLESMIDSESGVLHCFYGDFEAVNRKLDRMKFFFGDIFKLVEIEDCKGTRNSIALNHKTKPS